MKQYHTSIEINAPIAQVWQAIIDVNTYPEWNPLVGKISGRIAEGEMIRIFIKPLNQELSAKLIKVIDNQELTWLGVRFAGFLLTGKHYYKLEKISETQTRLLHGEYFSGLFSNFIPAKLLKQMESVFIQHNEKLKSRLESNL